MQQTEDIIFGIHPVVEAIQSGKEIDKIYIQQDIKGTGITELRKAIKEHKIPFSHVPVFKLNKHVKGNHQGVIAFVSPIAFANLEMLVPSLFEQGKTPLILILDRITDVRNFGAICRTAYCAGVDAVVIPKRESAQINADAMKTSAGALNYIPVCKSDNLTDTAYFLQSSGIQIVACTEKTNELIYQADFSQPTAIIMGNEESGISNQLMKLADAKVKIPMLNEFSSLNVANASAIIVYEAVKQRSV
ncbi:MAG TPA: 23S rRNA (guanosine(2251)-2'-O)-methyltransferase RlmB [Vicingaceae bacterium]|jgi:23S rRNA (guanosine2251-2'-O)-methyltransferase|nr:23S rRNA (guanosine(2251)-2'-O)-methyltransferase RlmB [Vicingaceae bacterium]